MLSIMKPVFGTPTGTAVLPVGAMAMGRFVFLPKISVDVSMLGTSTST